MLDLVDMLLLRRGIPADDRSLAFRRIDGNPSSKVIYFLPWHTPFRLARATGLLPVDFLAAYETPTSIVSSEPALCVEAMLALVTDAMEILAMHGVRGRDALIIGLSVGSYPAINLANHVGARVCAVASADRGDLVIWESFATRIVKRRAIQKGYGLGHYSEALQGTHPAETLRGLGPNSLFVFGRHDPFIPTSRVNGLLRAIDQHAPRAHVIKIHGGHLKALIASACHQRALASDNPAHAIWQTASPSVGSLPAQPQLSRPTDQF
jgi:hypothetical protein